MENAEISLCESRRLLTHELRFSVGNSYGTNENSAPFFQVKLFQRNSLRPIQSKRSENFSMPATLHLHLPTKTDMKRKSESTNKMEITWFTFRNANAINHGHFRVVRFTPTPPADIIRYYIHFSMFLAENKYNYLLAEEDTFWGWAW